MNRSANYGALDGVVRHRINTKLGKIDLQHILTAATINIVRVGAWLFGNPHAKIRMSHFASLAPLAPALVA